MDHRCMDCTRKLRVSWVQETSVSNLQEIRKKSESCAVSDSDHSSSRETFCDVWMSARHLLKRHFVILPLFNGEETARLACCSRPIRPAHCSSNLGHWSEFRAFPRHDVEV